MIGVTACQKNATQSTAQIAPTDTSANPADGNLATTPVQAQPQAVPANTAVGNTANYPVAYNNADYLYNGDADTGEQPVYASEPPPPLPDYSQPQCPAENEIWTPGYWDYSSAGYYWVPGAWVLAPYVGALWTPPYWAYENRHYHLHHGYWAANIGFYGGVYYGFGFIGHGYYGGYWRNGIFNYNRSVTNVNVSVIRNVYTYNVRVTNVTRISYNGGTGGIQARPIPAEMAVLQERRTAPVAAQVQHMREASTDRAQFMQANRGRPPVLATARPLPTAYHAPAAPPAQPRPAIANRENTPGPVGRPEARPSSEARPAPNAASTRNESRAPLEGQPVPARPAERGNPAFTRNERPMTQPAPAEPRPETHAAPQARPEMQPRFENHPAPQPHAAENRPAPQPRVETRPAPRPQPRVESRPAPQPQLRMGTRPAPVEPRPEARPAPVQPRPEPQPHVESRPAPQPRAETHPAPEARPNPKDTRH